MVLTDDAQTGLVSALVFLSSVLKDFVLSNKRCHPLNLMFKILTTVNQK